MNPNEDGFASPPPHFLLNTGASVKLWDFNFICTLLSFSIFDPIAQQLPNWIFSLLLVLHYLALKKSLGVTVRLRLPTDLGYQGDSSGESHCTPIPSSATAEVFLMQKLAYAETAASCRPVTYPGGVPPV